MEKEGGRRCGGGGGWGVEEETREAARNEEDSRGVKGSRGRAKFEETEDCGRERDCARFCQTLSAIGITGNEAYANASPCIVECVVALSVKDFARPYVDEVVAYSSAS